MSVCVSVKERKRQHFLALGHNDLASSVLYELTPIQLHFSRPSVFSQERSPVAGSQGAEEKVRSRVRPVREDLGECCVLECLLASTPGG